MGVTFTISGERANHEADACPVCRDGEWQTCAACGGTGFCEAYRAGKATPPNYLDLCESNAAELLRWLGYEVDANEPLMGVLTPAELRSRCTRRLAPTAENIASDLPRGGVTYQGAGGARVVIGTRAMGYLRWRAELLLAMATTAGDRLIEYA